MSPGSLPPERSTSRFPRRGLVRGLPIVLLAILTITPAAVRDSARASATGTGDTPLVSLISIQVSRTSPTEAGVVGYADATGLPIDVVVNGVVVSTGIVGWTGEYWILHVPVTDGATVNTRIAPISSPTVTVPEYASRLRGPAGFVYADGTRLMRDGAPVTFFGVDDNTVFTYALLTWGYGQTQFAGSNQNFPSGPGAQIPGIVTPDDLWREYFRYFLHYQQNPTADSPSPNLFRVWVVDQNFGPYAYDVWESNPTVFYDIFDKMLYWAGRAGVSVVPIIGQHHIPTNDAFYDRTSPEYARHIAFARGVIAHYDGAPEIAMWDLWNEADVDNDAYWLTVGGITGYRAWLTGLVVDLRPYSQNHLFTVGTCEWDTMPNLPSAFGVRTFFLYNDIPGIDVAHQHIYGSSEDQYLIDWQTDWGAALGRPYYIGELGYNGVNQNGLGYGHWPWFTRQWRAGGAGPITEMVWSDNGKGPYADYPYRGSLPNYPSGFAFSLALNPSAAAISPGESALTTVTASLTTGPAQSVNFSASGLPSGASASFSVASCSPTCTSTLNVSTSPATSAGAYTVTVTAVGGGATRTATYTLTLRTPCPSAAPSYPTDSWDRVWCDSSFSTKLGDLPDEPSEMFDNNWFRGTIAGLRADDIGFRSGRTLSLPATSAYTFTIGGDDGIRLWIDGTLLLDQWIIQAYTTYNVTTGLSAGSHQARVDYFENLFDARVSFRYAQNATPDTTPPAMVVNLTATFPGTNNVSLGWTAPGDDGNSGIASTYDFRYSTQGPLNGTNFLLATPFAVSAPRPAGTVETVNVTGLSPGTRYWFALRTADEVPNWSPISNGVDVVTTVPPPPPDQTPPARVMDLGATTVGTTSVTLRWTAPGDDGMSGNAAAYDIRYTTLGPLDDTNFLSGTAASPSAPAPVGVVESWTLLGLVPGTRYWIALRASDEVPNWSPVSNDVDVLTATPPPPPDQTPPAAVTDLALLSPHPQDVTLQWTAPGDDGNSGTASAFDVRYTSAGPIDNVSFPSALSVGSPTPGPAGTIETLMIAGLSPGVHYWFALRAADEVPNWSPISNVVDVVTPVPPAVDTTPPAVGFVTPITGVTVAGNVSVSVWATDDTAVASVSLFADGVFRSAVSSPPYEWTWNSDAAQPGTHQLSAVAEDPSGNRGSAMVEVVVPTVPRVSSATWDSERRQLAIAFSKPMNQTSVAAHLRLTPDATYAIQWQGDSSLLLVLDDTAVGGQTYIVTIDRQARDTQGIQMSEAFSFGFRPTADSPGAPPLTLYWMLGGLALFLVVLGAVGSIWQSHRRVRALQSAMTELSDLLTANSAPEPTARRSRLA